MDNPNGKPVKGFCHLRTLGMGKEFKFVSFQEFKARTEGPGGWEGYLSKTGEIDDGGDLIVQGAYQDTIPDFKARGFNADSHDWTFSRMIGFPLDAKEDDQGLYVTSQYHSTPDAQLVRTKALERLQAGKGVYMSIGYEVMPPDQVRVEPDKYAEVIPQYSRKDMVEANLLKALQFPWIRVVSKVNLFEGSIVSVPMLRSAEVTSVKSATEAAEAEQDGIERLNAVLEATVGSGLVDGPTYTQHLSTVVDAVKAITDRTEARAALRVKEGRVLSSANWSELQELYDRLGKLLDAAKPRPKDDEEEASKSALTPDDIRRLVARAFVWRAEVHQGVFTNG